MNSDAEFFEFADCLLFTYMSQYWLHYSKNNDCNSNLSKQAKYCRVMTRFCKIKVVAPRMLTNDPIHTLYPCQLLITQNNTAVINIQHS